MKTRHQISHFLDSDLQQPITELYSLRSRLAIPKVIQNLLKFASLITFFSLFFSFFRMFFDGFGGGAVFLYVVIGFFVLVIGIIIYSILNKSVVPWVSKPFPVFKSGLPRVGLIVLSMALFALASWEVSRFAFHNVEMGKEFILQFAVGIGAVIALVIASGLVGLPSKMYPKRYARDVLPRILGYLSSDAAYSADGKIEQRLFAKCGLYGDENIVSYKGKHLLIDPPSAPVRHFSHLEVKVKEVSRAHSKTRVRILESFKGLMLVIQLPTPTPVMELRKSDLTSRLVSKLSPHSPLSSLPDSWEVRKTGKETFDDKYSWVMPIEAIPVRFASEFLQLLVHAEEWAGIPPEVAVKEGYLYLGFNEVTSFFEPNWVGKIVNPEELHAYQLFWESIQGLSRVTDAAR